MSRSPLLDVEHSLSGFWLLTIPAVASWRPRTTRYLLRGPTPDALAARARRRCLLDTSRLPDGPSEMLGDQHISRHVTHPA